MRYYWLQPALKNGKHIKARDYKFVKWTARTPNIHWAYLNKVDAEEVAKRASGDLGFDIAVVERNTPENRDDWNPVEIGLLVRRAAS